MYFDNFYGETWEGITSDGEFTSMQSLYPLDAGSVPTRFPTNYYRGLPRILAERGYSTLSAHAYYGSLWRMKEMHPRLGFQTSLFRENFEMTEELGLGLADSAFFRQMVPRLEELPRPFMSFMITLSTHHPFGLPKKYKVLRLGSVEGTLLGDYLQTIHHFDTAFGALIAQLESNGLLDESVVVVYGDHKSDVGGPTALAPLLLHRPALPPAQGIDYEAWQAQHRLPLLIHLPHDASAGVRSMSGGHLDIAPTVLSLLGIGDHDMTALGRDLTSGENSLVLLRNGSFVFADTLCVPRQSDSGSAECHAMRTGARLSSDRFALRMEEVRERLAISDLIITHDLIPRRKAP
jgi:lipoteichoic acid synthase